MSSTEHQHQSAVTKWGCFSAIEFMRHRNINMELCQLNKWEFGGWISVIAISWQVVDCVDWNEWIELVFWLCWGIFRVTNWVWVFCGRWLPVRWRNLWNLSIESDHVLFNAHWWFSRHPVSLLWWDINQNRNLENLRSEIDQKYWHISLEMYSLPLQIPMNSNFAQIISIRSAFSRAQIGW